MRDPHSDGELAGIMDAGAILPDGVAASWSVYWKVDDVDATVAQIASLGGSILAPADDTPYGRMATVADPAGAQFKLHHPNR
jgi:predicted enzyme related to lactoylglutathione lyase